MDFRRAYVRHCEQTQTVAIFQPFHSRMAQLARR
jgi:hypothetical protein